MSDVDLLRRAAALMREDADAAAPGPWEATVSSDRHWMLVLSGSGSASERRAAQCADDDTGAYIASWHPAVALAVADWLDFEADWLEQRLADGQGRARRSWDDAINVARTYLGEQP